MTTTTLSTELPAPLEALLELGLSLEQIEKAAAARPLTLAFQADRAPGAYFDVERVQRVLTALATFRHTKGRWAGLPIRLGQGLDPWQVVWIIAPIFGWVFFDDECGRVVRVIRTAWVEVPRKNGKSTLVSAILNVLLLADGEAGAEVYAAAGSREQAGRVFEDAKRMCRTSKPARRRVEVLKELISVPRTGGIFRALSRISEVAHGLNVSGGCIDEVHTLKLRRALVEAIETGTAARDQPLIVFITTADEAEEGTIYDEKHTYAERCASNVVVDVAFYGVVWAAEPADDPFAESTWLKANPGLGTSPTWAYMRREARKAATTPSYFPTYCRLHLNLRLRSTAKWLSMPLWDSNAGMVDRQKLKGRRAWGGLDLSAVSDLTAWSMVVESTQPDRLLEVVAHFWLPEDRLDELSRQLLVPLRQWVRDGFLTLTEGDAVDYETVEKRILADAEFFDMQRVGYDRQFAGQLVQNLQKRKGLQIAPIPQTYFALSAPCKELERLLRRNMLLHGGNPILRWHADNVEVSTDGNENIKPFRPDRLKTSKRIDGIPATVMAVDGWMRRRNKRESYAYTA